MSKPTGEAVEQRCGCRSANGPGNNIFHWCREAQELLKGGSADNCAPLVAMTAAEWNIFYDHYDENLNPVVWRQGKDGVWEDV
jgi:hypothetical protein